MSIQDLLLGHILRPSRSASSNSEKTATPDSGVVRHFEEVAIRGQTFLTEMMPSQYRSAFIQGRNNLDEEYLVWAANNSRLTVTGWMRSTQLLYFGNVNGSFTDGATYTSTDTILIKDEEDYAIDQVAEIMIKAVIGGDSSTVTLGDNDFRYVEGIITITSSG